MTDLHCHILHDIDDGPSGLDESLELCRIAWSNRIKRIVATPHIAAFRESGGFLKKRDERLEELRRDLAKLGMRIELYPGAEVLVGDGIYRTDCLNQLTINQSRYLLVEFQHSGFIPHKAASYISEIQSRGLIPILAHPERYAFFQCDYEMLDILLQRGVLAQVNASSLCASSNKAQYKLARELVRQKAISFLATDAHSVLKRPNNLLSMLSSSVLDIDYDYLDMLVHRNPDAVLRNKPIDTSGRKQIKKRWHG